MDSRRVLYMLNILNRETSGHENEIAKLYERALEENDDVIRLKTLLNNCTPYREMGNSLFKNGADLLEKLNSSPSKSLEILPEIKLAHESITNSLRISNLLMRSPLPFSETITVLNKKDTFAYRSALKATASACVYLMVLYAGPKAVKDLSWNDNVGIQEMIYSVNTRFLPALSETKRPNYSWVIRKKRMGGRALFGGDCFYLEYDNSRTVEVLCSALRKEPIGTHAYLNVNAYEAGICDVPYCWGLGNIVSAKPNTALALLHSDIAVKVRSPNADELTRNVPAPFECIRRLTDGKPFCISPDELLLALNQWQVGHEIELRRKTHNCLFCGKHVTGKTLVCPSHFTSDLG